MMGETPLTQTEHGLAPAGAGWFVLNAREAAWVSNEQLGEGCLFESEDAPLEQIGYDLHVLRPGQANGLYHREEDQEDFLVLAGECLLLVEGEERRLRAWDFVHCPPGTEHIFVGAGEGPCLIFMIGGRAHRGEILYPRSELALRHGAGVERETPSAREAYRSFPSWQPSPAPSDLELPFG
jgi:uncharacterized cupin superfamily protein